jgi:hypothetical protein
VESPLQLLNAAEYAAAEGRSIAVAFRLTAPQMTTTAELLIELGAPFASCAPYLGVPWTLLSRHREWVVGDAFSGQFRSAMSTLGARSVAMIDDGAITIHLARALLGRTGYARPGRPESTLKTLLGGLTHERLARLAVRERLELFTAFGDHASVAALPQHGIRVERNRFAFTRATARPIALPHPRVVLGSAAVADGGMAPQLYLDWVRLQVREGPVSYLPHRRESAESLRLIAALEGFEVVATGLPVELALAGTTEPLQIRSLSSSATVTLQRVLAGTGSTIRSVAAPSELEPAPDRERAR